MRCRDHPFDISQRPVRRTYGLGVAQDRKSYGWTRVYVKVNCVYLEEYFHNLPKKLFASKCDSQVDRSTCVFARSIGFHLGNGPDLLDQ